MSASGPWSRSLPVLHVPGPTEHPEESLCVPQISSSLKEAKFASLFLLLAPSSLGAAPCSFCAPRGFLSLVLHTASTEPQTWDHLPVPPLSRGAWPLLARQPHTSNGTSSVGRSGERAARAYSSTHPRTGGLEVRSRAPRTVGLGPLQAAAKCHASKDGSGLLIPAFLSCVHGCCCVLQATPRQPEAETQGCVS